jgi:hypothetical protein
VATVWRNNQIDVAFRRSLVGNNLLAWHQFVSMVMRTQITDQKDFFIWSLHQHGRFTVHLMYRALVLPQVVPRNHSLWKLRIPLNIKVFIWYLLKNIALTTNNLLRKQWKGCLKCVACMLDESIQHLFLLSYCSVYLAMCSGYF